MLFQSGILANSLRAHSQNPIFSPLLLRFCISANAFTSISSPKNSDPDCDCKGFLPWLERKAGTEISSALSIGNSSNGRALYAAANIQAGDCLLKVPYSVQLAPDNLPLEMTSLLGDEVCNVARVALLILHEKKLGRNSEWAPYISRLALPEDMHSSIFWSDEELKMIRPSVVYEETLTQKKQIERDFSAVKSVLDRFSDRFQDVTLQEFTYAYGLVTSRAWESSRGVSMIPFADFLNHDGNSESYVLCYEGRQHSEVIADRDYGCGEQVLIRYGRFSNATLLLDFGFTVSYNTYDQVQIELNYAAQEDELYSQKEFLQKHGTPRTKNDNEFTSSWNSFTIREVRGGSRKGKGIPLSLRAFARILICDSQGELDDLLKEAADSDGRVGRCPLKNKDREIAAHQLLLSEISKLVKEHEEHIAKFLGPTSCGKSVLRRRLARDLLEGELRVLKSACVWLKNYCWQLQKS